MQVGCVKHHVMKNNFTLPLSAPLLVLMIIASAPVVLAQNYTTALGIRGGTSLGVTLQQRIGERNTIEGIVQHGLLSKQTMATALYEKHIGILGRGANIYFGAGPHIGWNGGNSDPEKTQVSNMFAGASAIIGGEIKFKRMVFSADYKPAFNLVGSNNMFNGQTGISIRYILVKAPKKEGLIQKIKNRITPIKLPGRNRG